MESCFRFAFMMYVLITINFLSFIIFGLDKRKAIKHQRRISESSLLTVTFLGGTIGATIAMLIFRHKVSKKAFLWKFVAVIILQLLVLYFLKDQFILM